VFPVALPLLRVKVRPLLHVALLALVWRIPAPEKTLPVPVGWRVAWIVPQWRRWWPSSELIGPRGNEKGLVSPVHDLQWLLSWSLTGATR
jgi:hypothetical protein